MMQRNKVIHLAVAAINEKVENKITNSIQNDFERTLLDLYVSMFSFYWKKQDKMSIIETKVNSKDAIKDDIYHRSIWRESCHFRRWR